MTKYHLGRNGQVAPCEADKRPCPLGGIHYASKEEAQWEMMDLNIIRNHWLTGGMPGDSGWRCTCGWEPNDTTFSGRDKVNAHADEAHALEVDEAKAAFRDAQERQAPLLKVGQQVRLTYLPDRTGEREVIGRLLEMQGSLVVQPSYYKSDEFLTVVNSRGQLSGNVRLHTFADESTSQQQVPADFVSAVENKVAAPSVIETSPGGLGFVRTAAAKDIGDDTLVQQLTRPAWVALGSIGFTALTGEPRFQEAVAEAAERGAELYAEEWETTDATLVAYEELLATYNLENPAAATLLRKNEAEVKRLLREQVGYVHQERVY